MHVREVKPLDLEPLGEIAYRTGFFGDSAHRFFPAQALFCDLWVRPYLEGAGCCGFVGEDETGKPLGYILGTCSLRQYQRWILQHLPRLLLRALRGEYPGLLGSLPYLVRMARYPTHLAPLETYPAQLHINLLPESRGQGLGSQLMEAYLSCLRSRNVMGVQLSTTRENTAAVGLYQKFGFHVYSEYQSPLWQPWLGRSTGHVVMVRGLS